MKYCLIGVVLISVVFGFAGCSEVNDVASTPEPEPIPVATADTRAEDEEVLAVVKQYTDALKTGDRKAADAVLYAPRSKERAENPDPRTFEASNPVPWFDNLRKSKFLAEETRIVGRTPDRFSVRSVGSLLDVKDLYWIVDFEVIRHKETNRWWIKEISSKPGGLRSLDELKKEAGEAI